VVRSFTAVYGARGQNPAFLGEDRPLRPDSSLAWVRDKLEAEQHTASFARRYPDPGLRPMDDIDIQHGDTGKVLFGMGTYGSRSLAVGGTATARDRLP